MIDIKRLYTVRAKPNFYQESNEYNKSFLSENEAFDYMNELTNKIWKVPIIVIVEEGLAVVDGDIVFLINSTTIDSQNYT